MQEHGASPVDRTQHVLAEPSAPSIACAFGPGRRPSTSRWRAVAIDLDGTLIPSGSVCLHLAASFGHLEQMRDLEQKFAAGVVTNAEIADATAGHFRGLTVVDIDEALSSIVFVHDAAEVLRLLRVQGILTVLATVTWSFAAGCVAAKLGFDAYSGGEMPVDSAGALCGRVSRYFDATCKADFVRNYCRSRRIPLRNVVAIGDSHSDIPLFRAVGFSVAFNASEQAKAAASATVNSESLMDALLAVPGLLDDAAATASLG